MLCCPPAWILAGFKVGNSLPNSRHLALFKSRLAWENPVWHIFGLFSSVDWIKTLFGYFFICMLWAQTFRIFSACLTFIEAVCHNFTSNAAYFVRLFRESLIFFLWVHFVIGILWNCDISNISDAYVPNSK